MTPDRDRAILSAHNLCKNFGGLKAVNNANISVKEGSITGLIGPNGAGKTTMFNLLSNFIHPDEGQVIFNGNPIQDLTPHKIARKGCIRTFQVARVLSRLTVLENMLLATQQQTGENFLKLWINQGKVKQEERKNKEQA